VAAKIVKKSFWKKNSGEVGAKKQRKLSAPYHPVLKHLFAGNEINATFAS
jgi:hypothetical protein